MSNNEKTPSVSVKTLWSYSMCLYLFDEIFLRYYEFLLQIHKLFKYMIRVYKHVVLKRGKCFLSKISNYFKQFSWHNQWFWTMKDNAWIDKRYHILLYIMNYRIPVYLWFSQECCQLFLLKQLNSVYLSSFYGGCDEIQHLPGNVWTVGVAQVTFFDRIDFLTGWIY